jgi:hypothetical protein
VLKSVFEEIVFSIPDKYDQMTLKKIIDFLLNNSKQDKLVQQMRQEVEEMQRKVK